jgi:hypothetical protein
MVAATARLWWLSPLVTQPASGGSRSPEHQYWIGLLGQRFDLKSVRGRERETYATLVLKEVSLHQIPNDRYRPANSRPAAISLLFSDPTAGSLTSATHTLTSPRLGDVRLFLNRTPRDEYPDSVIYEAVLN